MMRLGLLLLVLAVKVIAIALIGPVRFPDSGEYLDIARLMLAGSDWLHDAAFDRSPLPPTVFRSAGYPLFLAAATALAGSAALYAVIAIQSVLSVLALGSVMRVAERLLGEDTPWLIFIAVAWTGSVAFLFDLSILTDSLYASLFILTVFTALNATLRDAPLSFWAAVVLGILWGYSLWVRSVGLAFTPLILIPFLVSAWRQPRRGVVALLAFLVPAAALPGAYMAWNHYRTGHAFIATSGQVTFLQPLFEMAKRGEGGMFVGDSVVDRLVRRDVSNFTFDELVRVNRLLFEEHKLNPRDSEAAQRDAFIEHAAAHPAALARNVLRNLGPKLAQIALDPFYTWNEVGQTITGSRVLPGTSEWLARIRAQFGIADVALFALAYAVRFAGYAVFIGFIVLPVLLLFRRPESGAAGLFYLWLLYFAVAGLYALIHLENRYLLPVIPAALIGVAAAIQTMRWKEPRRA
jgi:hypothetical protein